MIASVFKMDKSPKKAVQNYLSQTIIRIIVNLAILIIIFCLPIQSFAEHAGITLPKIEKEFTVIAMAKLVKLHNGDIQSVKFEYYLSHDATYAKLRFAGAEDDVNPQSGNHLSLGYDLTDLSIGNRNVELICEIDGKVYQDSATLNIDSTIKQKNRISDQVYILAPNIGWRSFYTSQKVHFWKVGSSLPTVSTKFIRIVSVLLHIDKNTLPVPGTSMTFLFDDPDGGEIILGSWDSLDDNPPQDFNHFNLIMYCNAGIAKIRKSGGFYDGPSGSAPISGLTDVKIPLP